MNGLKDQPYWPLTRLFYIGGLLGRLTLFRGIFDPVQILLGSESLDSGGLLTHLRKIPGDFEDRMEDAVPDYLSLIWTSYNSSFSSPLLQRSPVCH